jgi:micrococcal nuclease
MRWRVILKLPVVLVVLMHVSIGMAAELTTVRRVTDGDTVELIDGRAVRYIGVNTPEIDHKAKTADPFGLEARAFNADLVAGKVVRLEFDLEHQDGYGRTLAYVFLPDGSMVNERLLQAGLAYCLYKAPNTRYEQRLLAVQRRAMQEGRGMWRNWHEKEARYTGNANTRRFHHQGCSEARRLSARNRVFFKSRWDAFQAGYAPSRECLPQGHVPR